jgi:hypothetical protein
MGKWETGIYIASEIAVIIPLKCHDKYRNFRVSRARFAIASEFRQVTGPPRPGVADPEKRRCNEAFIKVLPQPAIRSPIRRSHTLG